MIRGEGYDTLVDLSLGREFSFFAMLLGIRRRVGFHFKGRGLFLTDKIPIAGYSDRPVIEYQFRILDELGISYNTNDPRLSLKIPDQARSGVQSLLAASRIGENEKILAVAPGGGKSWGKDSIYKQWDPERFAGAVNILLRQSNLRVVLVGDKEEEELIQKVSQALSVKAVSMNGRPLEEVCALFLRAEAVLCNDGGLLHLANALGSKTVSIFGPTDERVYGPYGDRTVHEEVTQPVACRPCYKNFSFPPCPYNRRCLDDLSIETVAAAVQKVLKF